ncbi:MAG: AMIN domain-containing protein, partial [Thermodesulfobacteriota bacterium]
PAAQAPKPAPAAPAAKPAAEPAKAATATAGLRTISAVTATVSGGTTRITVTAGSPVEGFTAFPLAGPPRFVVDMPGRFAYQGASSIPVAGGALTAVRVGAYPDKVRLVLDYAKPGADGRPGKAPTVTPTPQGLAITME